MKKKAELYDTLKELVDSNIHKTAYIHELLKENSSLRIECENKESVIHSLLNTNNDLREYAGLPKIEYVKKGFDTEFMQKHGIKWE